MGEHRQSVGFGGSVRVVDFDAGGSKIRDKPAFLIGLSAKIDGVSGLGAESRGVGITDNSIDDANSSGVRPHRPLATRRF
jgi:hypothetical protein